MSPVVTGHQVPDDGVERSRRLRPIPQHLRPTSGRRRPTFSMPASHALDTCVRIRDERVQSSRYWPPISWILASNLLDANIQSTGRSCPTLSTTASNLLDVRVQCSRRRRPLARRPRPLPPTLVSNLLDAGVHVDYAHVQLMDDDVQLIDACIQDRRRRPLAEASGQGLKPGRALSARA